MKRKLLALKEKLTVENLVKLFNNKREKPLHKGLAVALGVFIGLMPVWGVQTLTAIVSAHFFKLNKPIVVVASHVNFTPLYPLVAFLSLKLGFFMFGAESTLAFHGITLSIIKEYLIYYLLGIIPLAFITASFFGFITLLIFTYLRYRKLLSLRIRRRKLQPIAVKAVSNVSVTS